MEFEVNLEEAVVTRLVEEVIEEEVEVKQQDQEEVVEVGVGSEELEEVF